MTRPRHLEAVVVLERREHVSRVGARRASDALLELNCAHAAPSADADADAHALAEGVGARVDVERQECSEVDRIGRAPGRRQERASQATLMPMGGDGNSRGWSVPPLPEASAMRRLFSTRARTRCIRCTRRGTLPAPPAPPTLPWSRRRCRAPSRRRCLHGQHAAKVSTWAALWLRGRGLSVGSTVALPMATLTMRRYRGNVSRSRARAHT